MNNVTLEKLKEHKQHGDIMLPIALYPVTHNTAGQILPYHWHNEFEFIYMSAGQAVFTIDDEAIMIKSGECIFINGGQIHSGFSEMNDTTYFSVVFSTELLTNPFDACYKLFDEIKTGKFKILSHFKPEIASHKKVISELEDIMKELTEKALSYELIIKSRLLTVFSTIFRNSLYTLVTESQRNNNYSRRYDTLKNIMGYIYKNYSRKIRLTDLGKSVNLTPQYLCKFFKEMTNTKIVDYINHYRIETARNLLKVSTLSITDIALECGFDNLSYFNRVFKRQTGCTPKEYRSR